ncbi:MAG: 16S rRNA (guanine(527)-N(7))-methyltransferase RsmG [Rhodospirillaceae bacterium]|nr:16S rRNA (guanine(527)-N(7))-methyltransferase RsmG [Rhodospirillaceae bacterium]MBT5458191.1 16S rRNA (guanine(527)-N(7))-methyltransferase RsmG [Rhodospirillaceae bacterium]
MTKEAFAEIAHVSRETLDRLEAYAGLLRQWQSAVNLVGADTLDDLWRRHMLDSAQLTAHIPENGDITDFGSGAGFPGLVLSIMLDRPVHLVESIGKKAAFLREAARITGAHATVHLGRIEDQDIWPAPIITARALAPLDLLLDYAEPYYRLAGADACCLFLKGARAEEELTEAAKNWTMAVERFSSVSDPKGVVLRFRDIARD